MIFVDTNVWMYAVGRPHPLRGPARGLVRSWVVEGRRVATSAEVLQELVHAYVPVARHDTLQAAILLATDVADVWPVEEGDVVLAAALARDRDGVAARDLMHLATCLRRDVDELATFDRAFAHVFRAVVG